MIRLPILVWLLLPHAALATAHSGVVTPRTGPELSDIALFALAAVGVWLVRRAMRRRFAKKSAQD
ncbi:MAG TPA: hypothetical protein VFQ57_03605 [Sphingomonas sp.]|jgi:membrane protein implicated in regulation of membrane protease activity|nr:hypothetical protein [Sphingomonas sp.]